MSATASAPIWVASMTQSATVMPVAGLPWMPLSWAVARTIT